VNAFDLATCLDEIEARNSDNVTRTESYLQLYAYTRTHGPDLPWVLMAHLVSRNTGYLFSDLASRIERRRAAGDDVSADAMEDLALLLERGNRVIFDDAWRHVVAHVRRREGLPVAPAQTTRFMHDAWQRYEREGGERRLVLDLVFNEQNVIERRVVHHERFATGLRLVQLIEMSGREKPIHFPDVGVALPEIVVGGFADLYKRIETGRRIFDEVVDPHRDALFAWAREHPHTGSRAAYGDKPTPTVRESWPVDRFLRRYAQIHAPLEDDPQFP
jgi:hypothetical protein